MEICLRLGRLEEESAMKLMLEEESRERRKEVQRLRKMTKLELEDNIG